LVLQVGPVPVVVGLPFFMVTDFGELLEGAEASLLTTQGEIETAIDESATLPTELIMAQTAYLEAFEEVIHKQIF